MNLFTSLILRPLRRRRNARRLAQTKADGIYESRFVELGGIEQWITIRGQRRDNPVLLVVHGGPGLPTTPFSPLLVDWEEFFTVVQWEQRGAGKTFRKNGPEGSLPLSYAALARDGIALAEHLRDKLGQPLLLLGSAGGSITSALMAQQRPELFAAWVGASLQGTPDGLGASYALVRTQVEQAGDREGLAQLAAMGADPVGWSLDQYKQLTTLAVNTATQVPNLVKTLVEPAIVFDPQLSLQDIMYFDQGMQFSMQQLFDEFKAVDLSRDCASFALPVFVFQGEHDVLAPTANAQIYLDQLTAPHKKLVVLKQVGHLGEFVRPKQTLHALREHVRPCAIGR